MKKSDTLHVTYKSYIQEPIQIFELEGRGQKAAEKVGAINFISHAISDPICEDAELNPFTVSTQTSYELHQTAATTD